MVTFYLHSVEMIPFVCSLPFFPNALICFKIFGQTHLWNIFNLSLSIMFGFQAILGPMLFYYGVNVFEAWISFTKVKLLAGPEGKPNERRQHLPHFLIP